MFKLKFPILLVIAVAFIAGDLHAQCQPKYILGGEAYDTEFGRSVAFAGDVNGDGYGDIIVGAHEFNEPFNNCGRVFVYSGFENQLLSVYTGENSGDYFGYSVAAAGDVNNDGYDDIIVGAPQYDDNRGRVYVYSGLNQSVLYIFDGEYVNTDFGLSVASAGDINQDGFDDIMAGAPLYPDQSPRFGRVQVFSGQNGEILYTFNGTTLSRFGSAVAPAGDVNSDGFPDIIVGAYASGDAQPNCGRAYVYSGNTGEVLHIFEGQGYMENLGHSVSGAGDVNYDGFDDLIVGSPYNYAPQDDPGQAIVFSGQTGAVLHQFSGAPGGRRFGWSVASAGDINNDGYSDLMVGAINIDCVGGTNCKGRAYVYSGQDGSTIYEYSGSAFGDEIGTSVSAASDLDLDGYQELLLGAPQSNEFYGSVFIVSGSYCTGSRGDVNGDGVDASILDLNYLVGRIFRGAFPGSCTGEADVNSDGVRANILDLAFLVNRIFRNGPAPGSC